MPAKMPVIESWQRLGDWLNELPRVDMACRGENQCYSEMKARIDRCVKGRDPREQLRIERAVCQRFREHAPIHLAPVEHPYLQTRWLELVVMQHYGAPTRLLDWTKSPWVASYFAAFGGWRCDGYIYAFERDRLEKCIRNKFGSEVENLVWGPNEKDLVFSHDEWKRTEANDVLFEREMPSEWVATYYSRQAHFPRLIAQQGLFTFGSRPNLDHWKLIRRILNDSGCYTAQIKPGAKADILKGLNGAGLNGATLFPGADGIGRSLEGFARAWPLRPRPSQV